VEGEGDLGEPLGDRAQKAVVGIDDEDARHGLVFAIAAMTGRMRSSSRSQ
jgi:hypothetical protein